MLVLNKTCRYGPHFDLLIAHRDDLKDLMARFLPGAIPGSSGATTSSSAPWIGLGGGAAAKSPSNL